MSSRPSKPTPPPPGLWQRIGPGAFAAYRFNPYRIGALALVLALAVVGATYLGNRSSDDGSTTTDPTTTPVPASPTASASASAAPLTPAQTYRAGLADDFAGVSGIIISYQQTLAAWDKDTVKDSDLVGTFTLVKTRCAETRDLLAKRTPFDKAPRALSDYQLSAQLFLESARVGSAALQVPKGPLRDQLRLQVNRLRALADRTFDQANAEFAPALPAVEKNPDINATLPLEVPDFAFQQIAPGPPLDITPPKPAAQRETIKDKAQQPFSAWADAVKTAPSAAELATAINRGTTSDLQAVSRRFTAASDSLFTAPDPEGEHIISVRVQLGLVVDAEAGRAAQAAALTTGLTQASLRSSAQRLALLGDRFWDPRLGTRDSGFPAGLLQDPA